METLERLRALCLALPSVIEREGHGEPTWFVEGKKVFVMYADHHHDDRVAFWCAAYPGVQYDLSQSDPKNYFVPPYVGGRGWLGVRLDTSLDWDMIADIVTEAYRVVAPSKLLAQVQMESGEA